MAKIKELFLKYKEIIMYLIFGVLTTFVSWGSYALFEMLLGVFISDAIVLSSVANVLSWIMA
ncbi:MAG: GtrA family protein, partial [Ruminococcus sp.]|nr:GtrA family protein [Ruminococcus sp.]